METNDKSRKDGDAAEEERSLSTEENRDASVERDASPPPAAEANAIDGTDIGGTIVSSSPAARVQPTIANDNLGLDEVNITSTSIVSPLPAVAAAAAAGQLPTTTADIERSPEIAEESESEGSGEEPSASDTSTDTTTTATPTDEANAVFEPESSGDEPEEDRALITDDVETTTIAKAEAETRPAEDARNATDIETLNATPRPPPLPLSTTPTPIDTAKLERTTSTSVETSSTFSTSPASTTRSSSPSTTRGTRLDTQTAQSTSGKKQRQQQDAI